MLTDRLVADALGRLSAYDREEGGWRRDLARPYLPLSVGAAAAVIAAFLWLPKTAIPHADGPTADAYGLAPNEPLGAVMMSSEDAPTMAVLLATHISERAP
ncbi:MAG: hypothetical protein AB7T31_04890 [Gemmatimonadales bacterium]